MVLFKDVATPKARPPSELHSRNLLPIPPQRVAPTPRNPSGLSHVAVPTQDLAAVRDAALWEWARKSGRWTTNHIKEARHFEKVCRRFWPLEHLGDPDVTADKMFSCKAKAVTKKIHALQRKWGWDVVKPRASAITIIDKYWGYLPSAHMHLISFFRVKQNAIVNKGSRRKRGPPPPARPVAPPVDSTIPPEIPTAKPPLRTAPRSDTTPVTKAAPPEPTVPTKPSSSCTTLILSPAQGLKRVGRGGGGGAAPIVVKLLCAELVYDCNVPVTAVPKVLVACYTAMNFAVIPKQRVYTHAQISTWVQLLAGAALKRDLDAFRACRELHPHIMLHISHDATSRRDKFEGKRGHLMDYFASYYDPELGRTRSTGSAQ